MSKKIIVIGGGISGLTAAVYGAKAGFQVLLLEKNTVVGGECTGWDRQGYHIDNCIHWLMGTTPGTALYKVWETVGAVGADIPVHQPEQMYTSELGGRHVTLWRDIGRTEKELLSLSPEDEGEIKRLMDACRLAKGVQIPAEKPPELMGPMDGLKMTLTMGPALRIFKMYAGQDIADLAGRFRHPLIRAMLSDFCTMESLAHSFAMAYGNFVSGDGGIPAGGSRAMALRMEKKLKALGGEVKTGAGVRQILLEGEKAAGVLLEDGSVIPADYVVPACDTCVTFGKLLPERYMGGLLRKMYEDREAYPVYGTFQTAFALDSAEDLIGPERMLDCEELCYTPEAGKRLTVKSYAYEPSFAPKGKQIVQTMMGGTEKLYDYWHSLQERKGAYTARKLEIAEQTKSFLERRFPACAGKLTLLDSWTPVTYERYCGAYKGFYQSFTITKKSDRLPYPSALLDGISNLVLAGQWLNPPGGLPGAATAGKFAVQRILKKEGQSIKI